MSISFALLGSTAKSLVCAQALLDDPDFELSWVMTPKPRPVGRQQKKQKSLVHQLAETLELPALLIDDKLDQKTKQGLAVLEKPDMLLVVDFGYFLPNWLLEWLPHKILNIHPSALPAWRGSSPGQFVLLSGQKTSGVSLIEVTNKLDQGPIYWQEQFAVEADWTQTEYYQVSFGLVAEKLTSILKAIQSGELTAEPQPTDSPTPEARKLDKEDAFLEWSVIEAAQQIEVSEGVNETETKESHSVKDRFKLPSKKLKQKPSLLMNLIKNVAKEDHPHLIKQAVQAFNPWPLVWTKLPTKKGPRRMQLINVNISPSGQLVLETVKMAGLKQTPWNQVKNLLRQ